MIDTLNDLITNRMPWWVIPCVAATFLVAFAAGVQYGKRYGERC